MNYQETEKRFRWLEQQLTAGQISMDHYRAGLNELRVTDSFGRLWMPQERTGTWYVYLDGQWQPASAVKNSQQPISAYSPSNTSMRSVGKTHSQATKGSGNLGVTLVFWLVAFVIIALVVWFVSKEAMAVVTAGVVALISLVVILASAAGAWEGQVMDIFAETKRYRDSNGHWQTQIIRYLIIRQPNGSTKKTSNSGNWKVGDYVVKRRGEMSPRIMN